ncbi:unnamed protein product [Pedinophyceae sp. YPF-701]|nr:unnamed protein product [Pedinophyceae sp. YPF-701]
MANMFDFAEDAVDYTDDFAVEDVEMTEDRETDPRRIQQRQKQIDYGKNTLGYQRYLELVSKDKRKPRVHPVTPDAHLKVSKRAFDGILKKWRRALHRWDPDQGDDGGAGAAPGARVQRRDSADAKRKRQTDAPRSGSRAPRAAPPAPLGGGAASGGGSAPNSPLPQRKPKRGKVWDGQTTRRGDVDGYAAPSPQATPPYRDLDRTTVRTAPGAAHPSHTPGRDRRDPGRELLRYSPEAARPPAEEEDGVYGVRWADGGVAVDAAAPGGGVAYNGTWQVWGDAFGGAGRAPGPRPLARADTTFSEGPPGWRSNVSRMQSMGPPGWTPQASLSAAEAAAGAREAARLEQVE